MKVKSVRPLEDWVMVEEIKPSERTQGGIIVPGKDAQVDLNEILFKVVEVGPGRSLGEGKRRPMRLAKGDTVLLRRTVSIRFAQEKIVRYLVQEDDVIAQVEIEQEEEKTKKKVSKQ